MHPTSITFTLKRCAIRLSIIFTLQLCVIEPNNAQLTDVAVNKTTNSSAVFTWNGNGGQKQSSTSSAAVNGLNNQQTVLNNGNNGPGFYSRACTATSSDPSAELGWWTVDLGATYFITSIQVLGVPEPDTSIMTGFFAISVMTSINDPVLQNVGGLANYLDATMNYNFSVPINRNGGAVKIAKIPNNIQDSGAQKMLTLCTVSIFSDGPPSTSTTTASTITTTVTTPTITTTVTTPTITTVTTPSTTTVTTPSTTTVTTPSTTTTVTTTSTTSTTTHMIPTTTQSSTTTTTTSTTTSLPSLPTTSTTVSGDTGNSSSSTASSSLSTTTASSDFTTAASLGLSAGAIAGIVVGVVVALIVAGIILLVCWRRRRFGNKKKPSPPVGSLVVYPTPGTIEKDKKRVKEELDEFSTREGEVDDAMIPVVSGIDVPVSSLPAYVRTELTKLEPFSDEFKRIPAKQNAVPVTAAKKEQTLDKSRYRNVVPYDFNRVKLSLSSSNDNSDFINASFIPGFNGNDMYYIATQGPKKQTLIDFWHMIYEYKCARIVMVTCLVESGKKKCEQYYGEERGNVVRFGEFSVETTATEHYADFVIRTLQVTKAGESGHLVVYQFHYEQWLDKEVPDRTFSVLQFRRTIHAYDSVTYGRPIVVHCSAGVGRTGTFIALDRLLDQVKVDSEVNVAKCVMELRKYRMHMIQIVEQYRFVHEALAEAVEAGDVVISATSFVDTLPTLKQSSSGDDGSKSVIEQQFMVVNSLKPNTGFNEMGTYANLPQKGDPLLNNKIADLCRVKSTIPYPGLLPDSNAFYLPGYRQRDAFIVTCHPYHANTTISFWSMVAAHRCHVVVSLTELASHDDKQKPYLPADKHSETYGPVKVTVEGVIQAETRPGLVVRQLHITPADKKYGMHVQPLTLCHMQVTGWSADSALLAHLSTIVDLLLAVHRRSSGSTDHTPTVIHCSNGSLQSGYVYAAAYIIEQIMDGHDVDVFTAVRHAQTVLPNAVSSLMQYEGLYELASAYLSRDQEGGVEYSNIVPNRLTV